MSFQNLYKNLNPKQKLAVDSIEGPVMVIAGPGTGKTTILTLRIANILLKTDTPPSGILALTFTEAGVKAMKSRLREIVGDLAYEIPIHTFHSFAGSVITEFGDHFPHLSRSTQMTDIEAEALLRDLLRQKKFSKLRPLGDPDFYISQILKTISDAKQEALSPEDIGRFAEEEIERIKADPQSISSRGQTKGQLKAQSLRRIEKCERTKVLAELYGAYEEAKRRERKMDFDDLIYGLLQALREDELLLRILQERFLYILVDEHQDTNDAQNLIVWNLASFFESPNLFVVGDDKQAIYRFQGASVENFLRFQNIWKNMKTISLTSNYRSHQNILDAAFKMIEKNYQSGERQELRTRLESGAKWKPKPLDLIISPDIRTEESYLIEKLRYLHEKDGGSVAVILRRNSDVARLVSLLEEAGIPASAERGANIFAHPLGELYFSLLEFLSDPGNTAALAATVAGGLWHLDFETRVKLIREIRSGQMHNVETNMPLLTELEQKKSATNPVEFLHLASDLSGFRELAYQNPMNIEIWRGLIALAENLTRQNNIENPQILIERLLSYRKTAERRTIKLSTGGVNSQISIMTAHASKGLEFDYVFLPFATEESWIVKGRGSYFVLPAQAGLPPQTGLTAQAGLPQEEDSADEIRDERRLFYVALTRARKHVLISFHKEDGDSRASIPLRFIEELDQRFIARLELPKISAAEAPKRLSPNEQKRHLEYLEYGKKVLLQEGLSVFGLNDFLECPAKFLYVDILKVPILPDAASVRNNIARSAMGKVWRQEGRNARPEAIAEILKQTAREILNSSFLPMGEKEALAEEMDKDAAEIASGLREHFSHSSTVITGRYLEMPFAYPFDKEKIEIRLHGQIDAIIEDENRVAVYEYKNRPGMSLNAIKGETKSGDPGYFRELAFYKMLLLNNRRYNPSTTLRAREIEMALVFTKPNKSGKCPTVPVPIADSDIAKVKTEIAVLLENVWSGNFLSVACDERACPYCAFRKLILGG